MSNIRTRLSPDQPIILSDRSIVLNEDPEFKPYFSIHFDKNGKIIGVDAPKEAQIQRINELNPPIINNVSAVSAVKIIHKPNSSPCCIMHKGQLICWG